MTRTVDTPETIVQLGPDPTQILIRPCWDFGCSPKGKLAGQFRGSEWPDVAVLGRPEPGEIVAPGQVVFSWLPVADPEASFEIAVERIDLNGEPMIYRTKGLWIAAQIEPDASWSATLTTVTRGRRFSGNAVPFTSIPSIASESQPD